MLDGTVTRNEVGYIDAEEVCASAGARMCTAPEIESGLTRGTGCSLDTRLIWTATPCTAGEEFCAAGKTIRAGRGNEANGDVMPAGRRMPNKLVFGARCCADKVVAASSSLPGPTPGLSATPCVQLARQSRNWPQPFVYRASQSAVCATSTIVTINGSCHGSAHSKADAVDVCTRVGARVCTATELLDGYAKGTGCNFDNAAVWSSTSCAGVVNGIFAVTGGGTATASSACLDGDAGSASVRCCADRTVYAAAVRSGAAVDGNGSTDSSVDDRSSTATGTIPMVFLGLLVALVLVLGVAAAVFLGHTRAEKLVKGAVHGLYNAEQHAAQIPAWPEAQLDEVQLAEVQV